MKSEKEIEEQMEEMRKVELKAEEVGNERVATGLNNQRMVLWWVLTGKWCFEGYNE
jgi:hypothetical protein